MSTLLTTFTSKSNTIITQYLQHYTESAIYAAQLSVKFLNLYTMYILLFTQQDI